MNPNDQKDVASDKQVSPWYTNFLLPAGLIVLLLLAGALYFGYQSYSASKVPKLPTESPSNINYPQVSASGVMIVKSETAMNAEWYNEAYKTGNAALCEKITFLDRRQSCKDNIISGEASKTSNISTCDKLSTDEGKIACRNPLYYREAVATKNTEICKKITNNDGYREQCVSKVILDQVAATSTGKLDVSVCETISDEYNKKTCTKQVGAKNEYELYQQLKGASDIGGCEVLTDHSIKSLCKDKILFRDAQEKKDRSLCEKITDQNKKKQCNNIMDTLLDGSINQKAIETDNLALCGQIKDENTKSMCNDSINYNRALTTKDVSLCKSIQQVSKQTKCQQYLTK